MGDNNYYGVAKGRQVRLYLCCGYSYRQTDNYPGSLHQGFVNIDEYLEFMRNHANSTEDELRVFDR